MKTPSKYKILKQISWLPELEIKIKNLPGKHTIQFDVLKQLATSKNGLRQDKYSRTWRLAAAVERWRKLGLPIESCDVPYSAPSEPRARTISYYWLPENVREICQKLLEAHQ